MKIFDYEEVVMNWDSFTYPIAVGTPVSIDGVLADNASAHGLIARTVFAKPDADETLKVMTGGIIDMEEIVAGYGQELSSAAVQALCGIHFYKEGVCIPTGGSGGGGVTPEIMAQIENAQWKSESSEQLFSETVTTAAGDFGNSAVLSYAEPLTADPLKVTFNGVEYTCPKIVYDGVVGYGGFSPEGPVFTEFPFAIVRLNGNNVIIIETAGTYSVSVSANTVTTTNTFDNEVDRLIGDFLGGGTVIEITNPNVALFCTVRVNQFKASDNALITINSDGTVSYDTEGVLYTEQKSYILVRDTHGSSSTTVFVDNNGSTLTPPGRLVTSPGFVLKGVTYTANSDSASFWVAANVSADYENLDVHYFAVKSSSEDSGDT